MRRNNEVGEIGYLSPTASSHAMEHYAPEAQKARSGTALALSGGGYRAALFHLGAVRRLNEFGLLSTLTTVSAVSGGSILAAHLAAILNPWPKKGSVVENWDERVAEPFRHFVSKNLRTGVLLRALLPGISGAGQLEKQYRKHLNGRLLAELPERPEFVFCATDMGFGVNWLFKRSCVGDYQIGFVQPPPVDFSVGLAVAASSCFPPVFKPMRLRIDAARYEGGKARTDERWDEVVNKLGLTDGGVYDNLGLEPVWKDHELLLVSDGGSTFDYMSDEGFVRRIMRYSDIQGNQIGALRKRWLISNYISGELLGTYWGIATRGENYELPDWQGYSPTLVKKVVAEIRTDLDAFSKAEVSVLENHGYLLADAAIRKHVSDRVPDPKPQVRIPHPDWMDETRVREALRDSHKRSKLGRR